MNAVDLYRRLPKKNCGKCRPKACMPFALSLIRGEADLAECPYLTPDDISALKGAIIKTDWREELIQSLREKMSTSDLSGIARDLGGEFRSGKLFIPCLGRQFEISQDGEIQTLGHITPWIRILLLHYINTHGKAELSGKWVSFSELKSGMVKASSFLRECEEPLSEMLASGLESTAETLMKLGAVRTTDFPAPYAWSLFLLPKLPVIVLYWPEEDEFPSKVKVLFDQTADRFLDVESIIFLLEGLVKNLGMAQPENINCQSEKS